MRYLVGTTDDNQEMIFNDETRELCIGMNVAKTDDIITYGGQEYRLQITEQEQKTQEEDWYFCDFFSVDEVENMHHDIAASDYYGNIIHVSHFEYCALVVEIKD